jgi:hypothetical protein
MKKNKYKLCLEEKTYTFDNIDDFNGFKRENNEYKFTEIELIHIIECMKKAMVGRRNNGQPKMTLAKLAGIVFETREILLAFISEQREFNRMVIKRLDEHERILVKHSEILERYAEIFKRNNLK